MLDQLAHTGVMAVFGLKNTRSHLLNFVKGYYVDYNIQGVFFGKKKLQINIKIYFYLFFSSLLSAVSFIHLACGWAQPKNLLILTDSPTKSLSLPNEIPSFVPAFPPSQTRAGYG